MAVARHAHRLILERQDKGSRPRWNPLFLQSLRRNTRARALVTDGCRTGKRRLAGGTPRTAHAGWRERHSVVGSRLDASVDLRRRLRAREDPAPRVGSKSLFFAICYCRTGTRRRCSRTVRENDGDGWFSRHFESRRRAAVLFSVPRRRVGGLSSAGAEFFRQSARSSRQNRSRCHATIELVARWKNWMRFFRSRARWPKD